MVSKAGTAFKSNLVTTHCPTTFTFQAFDISVPRIPRLASSFKGLYMLSKRHVYARNSSFLAK